MNKREAMALGRAASVRWLQPGDQVLTPRGAPMYSEAGLVLPGCKAAALLLRGNPVGVLILRPGASKLRYCDREGDLREEPVTGDSEQAQMIAGVTRMAQLIKQFVGHGATP